MRPPALALALAASMLLAGCTGLTTPGATTEGAATLPPVQLLDPLALGPHAVAWGDYDAGSTTVGGPDVNHSDYEYEARLRGRAWWPETDGAYPVLALLHGQHQTCAVVGEEAPVTTSSGCDEDEELYAPYPSHLGYEYLGEHLASHGYIVLSLLAHEINQRNGGDDIGMWARGELVLATLDAVRDGAQGMPSEVSERADMTRVGLMGHSRGGEGVVTASHVNLERPAPERHALKGIVALAPTDFNERGVAGVALLSLVPYCDGDVSTLHGLRTFDHSRWLDDATPKVQVLVRGTNHNFYNTRWYDETGLPVRPGDDTSFDLLGLAGSCGREREMGGWRWTPEETQQQSLVHVGGFLRWTVGGETGLAPWQTGALPLPEGACPQASAPCDDEVVISTVMPAARAIAVVDRGVPEPLELEAFSRADTCAGTDCAANFYSSASVLDLEWVGDATLRAAFDAPQDWSAFDTLSFRVAVPRADSPTLPAYAVTVEIMDEAGTVLSVDAREISSALDPTPDPRVETPLGSAGTSKIALGAVRVPLAGVDLTSVTEVRVLFGGEGRAFLTDLLVQSEPDVLL